MNKTNRISIAKTPYDIELDAEEGLMQYLAALRKALESDGTSETMADIELHITEILAEQKVAPGGVITRSDVEIIKEQLGNPEQFGDNNEVAGQPPSKKFNKRWIAVAGILLIVVGLPVIMWWDHIFPKKITTATEAQTYQQKVRSIEVAVESGDVEVRPGAGGEVSVKRQFKWSGTKPTISEKWSGEQLRIETDCPENENNCSVDYIISVPSHVTVNAQTQAGHINITGVEGDMRLTTSAGNIDITEAKGILWARTSDGNITGSNLRGKEVDMQTASGNIDLRFEAAPQTVKARASSGSIDVAVPSGDAYVVRAETSSGQRTVAVLQEGSATRRIDVQTSAGNVSVQQF